MKSRTRSNAALSLIQSLFRLSRGAFIFTLAMLTPENVLATSESKEEQDTSVRLLSSEILNVPQEPALKEWTLKSSQDIGFFVMDILRTTVVVMREEIKRKYQQLSNSQIWEHFFEAIKNSDFIEAEQVFDFMTNEKNGFFIMEPTLSNMLSKEKHLTNEDAHKKNAFFRLFEKIIQQIPDINQFQLHDHENNPVPLLEYALLSKANQLGKRLINHGAKFFIPPPYTGTPFRMPFTMALHQSNLEMLEFMCSKDQIDFSKKYKIVKKSETVSVTFAFYLSQAMKRVLVEEGNGLDNRNFINGFLVSSDTRKLREALHKADPEVLSEMSGYADSSAWENNPYVNALVITLIMIELMLQYRENSGLILTIVKMIQKLYKPKAEAPQQAEVEQPERRVRTKPRKVHRQEISTPSQDVSSPKSEAVSDQVLVATESTPESALVPAATLGPITVSVQKEEAPSSTPHAKVKKHKGLTQKDILLKITDKQLERERKQAQEEKEKKEALEERKRHQEQWAKEKLEKAAQAKLETHPAPLAAMTILPEEKSNSQRANTEGMRQAYLGEICKHMISINRTLSCADALEDEIVHYSLLYNIFRTFELMKMYQRWGGGATQVLNKDTATNLRNLIRHHGVLETSQQDVLDFAKGMKITLPMELMQLKKKFIWSAALDESLRETLCREFGLSYNHAFRSMPSNANFFENTNLYRTFSKFIGNDAASSSEAKQVDTTRQKESEMVIHLYLPMLSKILNRIAKMPNWERYDNPDLFIENYLLELQSLRFISMICAEHRYFLKEVDHGLFQFLSFIHQNVAKHVAHELYDMDQYVSFANDLEKEFKKLDLEGLSNRLSSYERVSKKFSS